MGNRKGGTNSKRFLSGHILYLEAFKEMSLLRTELSSQKGGGIINRHKETALSV